MQKVSHELQVAVMRLARRLRAERADHGLTLSQLSVLTGLQRHGSMTPGELAAHERVRPPSMTRTVAALVDLGLIERAPHPDDGRQVLLTLNEQGQVLLAADRAQREAWLARQLKELSVGDRRTLADAAVIMDRLVGL
ncbi:MAG: MarR family winged helix-turn-helix transcriptional regulator [Actinomycetes bacterium]|jgi:DNA-binding MarR family transcriptional regulator|nr:MarR family transcriptional regulator [Candidatus Nanopelagicales bacterium]MDP4825241.1 MarR family transcriptional regulator [Candidatus Nanopelagicales bacterium]MDP4888924.1 MarR family transcriptional regulator [Candidatus Nanopelagicales bacterium]